MTNHTYEGFFKAHPYCDMLRPVKIEEISVFTDHSKYSLAVQVLRNHFHQYPQLTFGELYDHIAFKRGQLSLLGDVIPFAYLTGPDTAYHSHDQFQMLSALNLNVNTEFQPNSFTGSLRFICTPDAMFPDDTFCIELVAIGEMPGDSYFIDLTNQTAKLGLRIGHNLNPISEHHPNTAILAKDAVNNALLYQLQFIFRSSRSIKEVQNWIADLNHISKHVCSHIDLDFCKSMHQVIRENSEELMMNTIGERSDFLWNAAHADQSKHSEEFIMKSILKDFSLDYAHPERGFLYQFCPEIKLSQDISKYRQSEISDTHCFSSALAKFDAAKNALHNCDIELWAIAYGEHGTYAIRAEDFHILGMSIKHAVDDLLFNKKENLIVQGFIDQLPLNQRNNLFDNFEEYSQKFVEYFAKIENDLRVDYIAKGQVFFVSEVTKSQRNIAQSTEFAEQWGEMDLAF